MSLRGAASMGLVSVLALALVPACAGTSKPTRFYVLTPIEQARDAPGPEGGLVSVSVGIEPIRIPEHLARAQIAFRRGSNRVELADFDQWAAPVDRALAQVLAENLALLIPSESVSPDPRGLGLRVDLELFVEVVRFDFHEDGRVELAVLWSLSDPDRKGAQQLRRSSFVRRAAGGGVEAGVAAMSAAVADLSRELAAAVRERASGV